MIASRLSVLVRLAGEVVRLGGSQLGSQRGCVLLLAVTAPATISDGPNRISSSGRGSSDRFSLNQRLFAVLPARCRTMLNCNPELSAWESDRSMLLNAPTSGAGGPRVPVMDHL
jgi:hypothetical protein